MGKKLLKVVAILLAAAIAIAGAYAAYVFIAYHRLPDTDEKLDLPGPPVSVGQTYTIVTWNLGFGAYSRDFGFFMDGGTESRARSKDEVLLNLDHAAALLTSQRADFMLLQELDIDATRSHHVDEATYMAEQFPDAQACFAQNYDSPYLFYPILKPHGAAKSGLLTLSNRSVSRFARIGLPIEGGFMKFLDLDRCYSKAWIPVDNGRSLVIYNLHLSAYTSDGVITGEQLRLLCDDMLGEYEAGNYVVAGGDFNKSLGSEFRPPDSTGENYTWAQPLDLNDIPEGLNLVATTDWDDTVYSCRNADGPYVPGESFTLTVDGFIVSKNVGVIAPKVVDDDFICSDHNPVAMSFTLSE